jgi:hypothetical protein
MGAKGAQMHPRNGNQTALRKFDAFACKKRLEVLQGILEGGFVWQFEARGHGLRAVVVASGEYHANVH